MEILSCHSNQTKELIFIKKKKKKNFKSASSKMLQMKFGPNRPCDFRGDVV